MFERLALAVEEVEVPVDGAALTRLWGLVDRLTAKATMAGAAFDAAALWDLEGDTSMTAWLRTRAGMTSRQAARTVTTSRRLAAAPVTAAAWSDGTLSTGQVEAITANVDDATAALFAEHEADLIPVLAPLCALDVGAAMRAWAARAQATLEEAEPPEASRSLHLSTVLDGRRHLTGDLDPEAGDVVATALRLATTRDVEGEPARTASRRRADALVDVCRHYLDHRYAGTGGRHRPHVNLVVDLAARTTGDAAAGRTIDGIILAPATISRVLCDAGVHRVVTDGASTILDYGRTTRTIPAPLFNALVIRDRHCRWPGCDRQSSWCEGHHIRHWEHGGSTELPNLALLCSRHHHRAHQPGWHVKLLPDATFETTDPTGSTRRSRPPPCL
jgi:hypothetical protein